MIVGSGNFEWDLNKDMQNHVKHGVSFVVAQLAFMDPHRVIAKDIRHSKTEKRFYCFGSVENNIITVRFVYRDHVIRIIGAGYWRKGRAIYEEKNNKI